VGGTQSGNEIVIDDDWQARHLQGKEDTGSTLAHEMQHTLDRQKGLMHRDAYEGIEHVQDDPKKLEDFLSQRIGERVASEVRAYERGNAVESGKAYADDGVTTGAEARNLLSKGGNFYREHYESEMSNFPEINNKYEVTYDVDSSGQVRAHVVAKSQPISTTTF